MGFLTDIAEIAGLLFVTYMAGWLLGYAAHRLTARAPKLEASKATRDTAVAVGRESTADALVKAPVVVPVATTPPPQVLASASAIEPVKATAVPDSGETPAPLQAAPAPAVSALDTLKSLSTAMPLMPPLAQPETPLPLETTPVTADAVGAAVVASSSAETTEPSDPIAAAPSEPATGPDAVEPIVPAEAVPAPASMPATSPAGGGVEPILAVPLPTAQDVEPGPAPVKPRIRVAPATRAGEIAAQPPLPQSAEPPPAPPPPPEPLAGSEVIPTPPMPASTPGVPWAGAIKGHEAEKFTSASEPEATRVADLSDPDETIDEPDAALDVTLLSSIADGLKLGPALSAAGHGDDAAAADEPLAPPAPAPKEDEAAVSPSPEPVVVHAEPAWSAPEPIAPASQQVSAPSVEPPPRRPALEEDAAMRAIEGGWSRRDVRALGDAPEMTDVTAAVSAAQVAVEQVLARNGVDTSQPDARAQAAFGKPVGLPQPRDGRRDSLKRIDGVGPLDEVTLNNLGIYHFDQIAKWTEREVLWLENHAFAVGRIGREAWQDQARELLAERDATRALR
ncbi:MAG TPA: hypothetical protein VFE64_08650 [Devosia sp.]|nr:hypothetical protein [Devosia sp.]